MKRLYEADFIRVISTLGIILFHFSSEMMTKGITGPVLGYEAANFSYGSLFVTVFFILSGGMVHYSCKNRCYSIKEYYKKRFLSIFPAFYVVFFGLHLLSAWKKKDFFFRGNPAAFFLSLFGMDGYFSYRFTTYYQIGEWFLGALVLLYLVYPLLAEGVKRHKILCTCLVFTGYATVFLPGVYQINDFTNLFSCLLSFWIGILFLEYREQILEQKKLGWICTVLFFLVLFVKIPMNGNIMSHIGGVLCFISLYTIGSYVMKPERIRKAFCFVSMISYPVYLIHHIVLSLGLNKMAGAAWSFGQALLYFLVLVLIILIMGYIIYIMVNHMLCILSGMAEKIWKH